MKTVPLQLFGAALGLLALVPGVHAKDKHYKIGLSNGWVGSEWRTQMVEEAQAAAQAWKARGVDVEVIVQSATKDVPAQIGDIRNFITEKVDAIIVNPNSPTALAPVFAQAKKANILVFATDGEVASKDAVFVGISQKDWAATSAKWLAETLGGKGNIITLNGVAGHPANQARVAGYKEVFAKYPNIKILNEANADWEEAKGQQVMKTLLATYPNLDGAWIQDGQAEGAWRAISDANRDTLPGTGELRASFVRTWNEKKFKCAVAVNPPGCMANALNVAVLALEGNKFKDGAMAGQNGNALYLPTPLITTDKVAEAAKQLEGKPDYAFVSMLLTPEELKTRFFR